MTGFGTSERKYHRTLFIPELVAQTQLWDNVVSQEAQKADEIIQMGNFLTIYPDLKNDPKARAARNSNILKRLELYRATSDSWVQIVGPNEVLVLNQPQVYTNDETDRLLRRMWFSDEPRMKAAIVNKNRLVTHGGLTHGLWEKLGKPQSAQDAAGAINQLYAKTIFQGKSQALGGRPNHWANPIWANPLTETYPSWINSEDECPFDQVHAGENINSIDGFRERSREINNTLSYIDDVQFRRYGSLVIIDNAQFRGLNLELSAKPQNNLPDHRSLYIEESLL